MSQLIASTAKVWTTPGGVHPPENKTQSMREPLGEVSIPAELVYPLSQHIGTPATPIVEVGETVLAGQKIAEAVGGFSVPVHASTSGTITAIEPRALPHSSGMSDICIVLASDGKHTFIECEPCEDYTQLDKKTLINKIREAGIAGLGGAGFPTAIKLNPASDNDIHTLIINGTECEPYITADDCLMQNYARELIAGTQLLAHILGDPKRVVIGIEDNKPDAIARVQEAANNTDVEVVSFPTKYPSGGEKQLIQILTGVEVPSGKIPAKMGMVIQNVGTAVAAYRAVRFGQPLTWRITTIVGEALKTQRNIKALLGTPIDHILNEHGFNAANSPRLIMGGPMMGFALNDSHVSLVKTTNCIIAPSHAEMPAAPPAQECIRCGMCAEACPASLLPQQLYWYAKAEEYERLQNHNLFDCIECGACSYVCPSNIPLVQYYRSAKGEIRQQEQDRIKSDHARQRFEFRKQRMEQAEQEKIAKREARKKAAEAAKKLAAEKKAAEGDNKISNDNTAADPVAAAMARVQAKQQDPAAQKAKLERALSSAKGRVEKLQEKLSHPDPEIEQTPEQKEKLEAQIKQAQVRLSDAEKNLAALSTTVVSTAPQAEVSTVEASPKQDAASAAIEKARANAEALAGMSPKDKLEKQLASLETRLVKAKDKLQKAETENSEHIEAFKTAVDKLQEKISATKEELGKEN